MALDIARILGNMDQLSVGYQNFFNDFQTPSTNFPPHNIAKISDNEFYLELAVAGFKRTEITIQEADGQLTITGDKTQSDEPEYQYRGIAARSFRKSFRIADHYMVSAAVMEDGILKVAFVRPVPEHKPVKIINIA